MKNLNVTYIQSELYWEDVDKNLSHFSEKINTLKEPTDLIILPEMFTTGFSMNSKQLAEKEDGKTLQWLRQQSASNDALIIGSIIIAENNLYYNRLIAMYPDGTYNTYDKRHLFRMAQEDHHYASGSKRLIITHKGWRICPLICYDLRFPVWSRNNNGKNNDTVYDCLIYIANWPKPRNDAWKKLLWARAIENQAYVVGVNRVGNDGKKINYSGDSMVVDPKGVPISKATPNKSELITATLDWDVLDAFREKFPVKLDADNFEIIG